MVEMLPPSHQRSLWLQPDFYQAFISQELSTEQGPESRKSGGGNKRLKTKVFLPAKSLEAMLEVRALGRS